MNNITQCCGLTARGKRCHNKQEHYSISGFCKFHGKRVTTHYPTGEECSICFNPLKNPQKLEKCGHSYCTECISKWLYHNDTCPYCRSPVEHYIISKAMLFGTVNKHIIYLFVYTYDSSNLDDNDYSTLCGIVSLNKEYTVEEWDSLKNDKRELLVILPKMMYKLEEYITEYSEKLNNCNILIKVK
jgi:hypothetical protein